MASKTEVITMHLANPDWTAKQIANALGCRLTYVNSVRQRCDLDMPRERARFGESIQVLGKAAFKAGLTVRDIQAMGVAK